ncbi:MAG TPA: hypothetical protein VLU94_02990, partial [Candidatus Nitrosotalea sp.]|nr:hypothetical protein [Candidatus Nitrosotalea sp.]
SELVSVDLPQGSWTNQASNLSFDLGDLAPGTNLMISVRIHPVALGFLTNVVNVAAFESDVDPSNNLAQTISEVRPMSDVQLGITSFTASILLGRDAAIEFGITNAGPGIAHRVSLQYPLVEGMQLKSFGASQGSATNVDGTLTFDLGALDAAASASVQIVVKPLVTGTLGGRASAVADEVDPDLSNNQVDVIWNVMPALDLQISQKVQRNPALLGQDIQFEIEVTNQGPSGASDLQLTDPLPAGTQLIDVVMSQGTFTNSNGILTGYLGDLPVGGAANLTLTLRADQLGMITNDVTASALEQEVAPEDNLAEAVVLIQPAADLALSLQAIPEVGILGQLVTYQLSVTNLGPNVASLVRLEDTLPTNGNVTHVEVSNGSWTNLPGQIVADFGSLDVGGVASLQVVISPAGVGEMTNFAIVSAVEGDINPTNNAASLTTPVRLDADLAIGMIAGSTSVFVDNTLSFTLSLTNLGPNMAQNIQVEDDLPPGSTIVDVEPSQGTWTNSPGGIVWTPGDLPPGSAATASLIVHAGITGGNTNTATVLSDEVDPDPSNNTAASVVEVLPAANLTISQQSLPTPGLLGQELTVLVTVTNLGPSVAHTVQVEDTLPVGIGLLRIETPLGSWTNVSGTVTWNAGDLQPNDVAGLSLVFRADQLGTFTNTTRVQADEADEDLLDNLSQAVVAVVPAIDLAVAQQVHPVVAAVAEAVIYDLSVTNSGPSDATGVLLQNLLPDGVVVLDIESSSGDWTNVNGTVTFRFGNLAVGAAATAQITLAANSPGILTNSVSVAADQSEVRPEDNQSSITSAVKIEAGLAVSIAPRNTAPLVNRDFGYELSVTNQGPGDATGVVLTDDLDAQAELVSVGLSQGTWTVTGQTVRCDLGPLAAGGSVSATIVVRPLSPGNLTNTTSVVADVLDRDLSDNSAQSVDTVYPPASLRIAQTASADSVLVNDHLDYQITVFNDTLYAVPQLVLADLLPAGAELTSSSTTYGTITNDQTTLTLDLSGLVPDSSAVLTITITPQIVGTITNEASLLSPYVDSANTNLVSRITTKVIATPTLEFEHSSNHLIFSWPQVAGNYTIESTDQLGAGASWSEVPNPQVIVDGRVTVTIKIFGEARFYRLTKL